MIFALKAPEGEVSDLDVPYVNVCRSKSNTCNLFLSEGDYDFTMRIYNSDGSEPEMCGNGIRCLAQFLKDLGEDSKSCSPFRTVTLIDSKTSLSSRAAYYFHSSFLQNQYPRWAHHPRDE